MKFEEAEVPDLMGFSRDELVQWLKWNDPNGEYGNEPAGHEAQSTEELREAALRQLLDGSTAEGFDHWLRNTPEGRSFRQQRGL